MRAPGREDQGQELHDRGDAAGHGPDPGPGPVPDLQSVAPASIAATKDIALANVFAPGSTAKVITAAAAFQYAGQTPRTSYVVPDAIKFWHGAWYHDAEPHPTQRYTIAGILAHSLNDGMIQVADHVTPPSSTRCSAPWASARPPAWTCLARAPACWRRPSQWVGGASNTRYQISFGQSVGVTALQMASVYATIANGGVRVAPSIVAGHTTSAGRYVAAPPAGQPAGHVRARPPPS